jgi:hypothetical protein
LAEWSKAEDIKELNGLFSQSPPTFKINNQSTKASIKTVSITEKVGYKLGRNLGLTGLLIILIIGGIYFYSSQHSSSSYSMPLQDSEHSNPAQYLDASGTYHPTFWGDKVVLNGKVTNNANHTNYKDIRIKVYFYSQTKTVISSQDYIVYDYVPYKSTKEFNLKIVKPQAAVSCGWVAIGGTFY